MITGSHQRILQPERCPLFNSTSKEGSALPLRSRVQQIPARRLSARRQSPVASASIRRSTPARPLGASTKPLSLKCGSAAASADGGWEGQVPQQDTAHAASATQGNATFVQAVCNVLNILLGVGLLSLPYALRQAGWAGLGVMAVLGYVMKYTGQALAECISTICKREGLDANSVGYEQVARSAFGRAGKALVSATMYVEIFGICSLLFIIMGDNLHNLLQAQYGGTPAFYMLCAAAAMIPTVWLPDVKSLSYLGAAGVSATLTVVATVLFTYLTGSFPAGAQTSPVIWSSMPVAFGCFAFCFAGHGVFPSIRASMKQPDKFPQVLNVAFLITTAMCATLGGLGYLMYGTAVRDVVTFNLPAGLLATLCSSLILISPFSKFALTLEPVASAATRKVGRLAPGLPPLFTRLVTRTAVAIACLVAARSIPFLALLMSLIGSVLTINVSLIFPAACHLKIHQGELSAGRKLWNWLMILLGVLCMLSGTYVSLQSIFAASA